MTRSEVLEICRQYGLAPHRKLGQNFLVSDSITGKILKSLPLTKDDHVLEIGPGLGALTGGLADMAGRCTVIEIDAGFVRALTELFGGKELSIVHGDFLKAGLRDEFTIIVSNLPYYLSSEILFRIATGYRAKKVYCMMQREFGERIMAKPGTHVYGALTVGIRFHFAPEILFSVPRGSFYPAPEVSSVFRELQRIESPLADPDDTDLFHQIVKSAFWGRRKTLLTALSESPHMNFQREILRSAISSLGIDPKARGESLGIEDFVRLTKIISPLASPGERR